MPESTGNKGKFVGHTVMADLHGGSVTQIADSTSYRRSLRSFDRR
jgi:hypothetical protein